LVVLVVEVGVVVRVVIVGLISEAAVIVKYKINMLDFYNAYNLFNIFNQL